MGRNVLISGASHGIGAATAIAFAKDGCNVGINYHNNRAGAERPRRNAANTAWTHRFTARTSAAGSRRWG